MARIPLEDTPIFTQLAQEYAARAAFESFFNEAPAITDVTAYDG